MKSRSRARLVDQTDMLHLRSENRCKWREKTRQESLKGLDNKFLLGIVGESVRFEYFALVKRLQVKNVNLACLKQK